MEMNFTDFLYDVFILESDKAEACGETNREQKRINRDNCADEVQ